MKSISILGPANSQHMEKIVEGLSINFELTLLSIHEPSLRFKERMRELDVTFISLGRSYTLGALKLFFARSVYKADLFWVHYASGYGAISTVIFKRRKVLSVWGSDVYDFPFKGFLHHALIRYVLSRFETIFSTSSCMATHVKKRLKYEGRIVCTPFGIDLNQFNASKSHYRSPLKKNVMRIGSCKALKPIYNQSFLIKILKVLVERNRDIQFQLCLAGDGPDRSRLEALTETLGLKNNVLFLGNITPDRVPNFLATLDIFAAFSINESFGVSLLEASAMNLPIVCSDVPGFREVVIDQRTGFICENNDLEAAVASFERLIFNPDLRLQFGAEGAEFVSIQYSLERTNDLIREALLRV